MTIQSFDLNQEHPVKIRQAEQLFGLCPPQSTSQEANLHNRTQYSSAIANPAQYLQGLAGLR